MESSLALGDVLETLTFHNPLDLDNGGKFYAGGDTMVGLLLGFPDGERLVMNKMDTRWWGKDSRAYMSDLLAWALGR